MLNPCSLCSANCCKTYIITVTAFDVLRICRAGMRHNEFTMLHEPRLLGFDPDMVLDTSDGYGRYILGLKSHPCIFLKQNRCTIHRCAPLSCRRYPFTLSRKLNARFCPLIPSIAFRLKGPDIPNDQLIKELEVHKKLVKEWNSKQGKKKDCVDFLLKKATHLF